MTDRLTRVIVARLTELRDIANAIKSVIVEDADNRVTFGEMAIALGPKLDRVPSPGLYRDIRQACKLLGLRTSFVTGTIRVIRGVRLK
jgi:hypothetical protein